MKNKKPQIILLVIMLLITAVQTVIILDYYLDTYSFGIFDEKTTVESYYRTFEEELSSDYLQPYRMIVKSGDNDSWMIDQNDALLYHEVIENTKGIIQKAIVDNPSLKYESFHKWDDLYKLKGITLEYRQSITFDYFAFMNEATNFLDQQTVIEKIHFQPIDQTRVTMYIKTSDNVLVYENIEAIGYASSNQFNELLLLLENNIKYEANKYSYYSQILGNERFADINVNPDIPVIIDLKRSNTYPLIDMKINEAIRAYANINEKTAKSEMAEQIKKVLLGASFDKHKTVINADGDMFFSNEYNIYSLYEDGRFSYKFTPSNEGSDKGNIDNAFYNAVEMINKFFLLNGDNIPKVIVSKVASDDNSYIFTFDYIFNNQLILLDGYQNAITIKANGTRVLEASGKLYEIEEYILMDEEGNVVENVANEYYISTLKVISDYALQLLQNESADIFIGYIRSDKLIEYIEPQLIIIDQEGIVSNYALEKVGE